jgi:2-amino-4-hydroxy-6-hydroxymethyldihydropteridine diphosphokinase
MTSCVLGIGSNQGNTRQHVERGVQEIDAWPKARLIAVSPWRVTAPVGGPRQQPPFLNGAALLDTEESPLSLLAHLQQIERLLGRKRDQRWGPRTLDLDLLLYGQSIVCQPELTVPHPWMAVRKFVAEPAADVAPNMLHPQIGWTLRRLWDHLRGKPPLIAVAGIQSARQRDCVRAVATRTTTRWVPHPTANETAVLTQLEAVELALRLKRHAAQQWAEARDNELVLCDFWWEEPLAQRQWTVDDPVPAAVEIVVVLTAGDRPPAAPNSPTHHHLLPRAARRGRGPYLQIPSANLTRLEHDLTALIDGLR